MGVGWWFAAAQATPNAFAQDGSSKCSRRDGQEKKGKKRSRRYNKGPEARSQRLARARWSEAEKIAQSQCLVIFHLPGSFKPRCTSPHPAVAAHPRHRPALKDGASPELVSEPVDDKPGACHSRRIAKRERLQNAKKFMRKTALLTFKPQQEHRRCPRVKHIEAVPEVHSAKLSSRAVARLS